MVPYTSDTMVSALKARFPSPAWAFLEQVRNGTGYARHPRTADVIAMSLWPSRGLEIHGIEIKVCRPDFERELKRPEKADAIQRYCHRWWIAAPTVDVAPVADIPPNWGLLTLKGKKIVVTKEAPRLEPVPVDLLFLASILRNAAGAPEEAEKRGFRLGKEEGIKEGNAGDHLRRQLDNAERNLKDLHVKVAEFETASGIKIIGEWNLPKIGEAAKALAGMLRSYSGPVDGVQGLINIQMSHLRDLQKARESAEELEKALGANFGHNKPRVDERDKECKSSES